ncbi:reverse transcriptase [Phytophthora megakarya]|uniref:Reverse transcriptase n=1 Tax=Phytophthora megakarya TaxID=4795 RepID=A0A225UWA4_9STRA|nr:reverse transcriptase [Phytophthora megakarya]
MLKAKIITKSVLKHLDPERTPAIAALMQEHEGACHPVTFTSRTLKANELNYRVVDKEVLALLRILDVCYSQLVTRSIKVLSRFSTLAWMLKSNGRWATPLSGWTLGITKCVKGEEESLGIIAASITPRPDVDAALVAIAPKKEPRKMITVSPPTIEQDEDILVRDDVTHRKRWKNLSYNAQEKEKRIADLKKYLDGEVNALTSKKEKTCSKIAANYEVDKNGLLFFCRKTLQRDEDRDGIVRMVVLDSLQQDFLHHYHASLEGGHQGVGRKYWRIQANFHWRGLYRSVQRYVGECTDYETWKGKPTGQGESPGNIQGTYPFEVISMDHISSLPKPFKGNTKLLIWGVLFTGYVITKAGPSREA